MAQKARFIHSSVQIPSTELEVKNIAAPYAVYAKFQSERPVLHVI
jgi:hypothetical protein